MGSGKLGEPLGQTAGTRGDAPARPQAPHIVTPQSLRGPPDPVQPPAPVHSAPRSPPRPRVQLTDAAARASPTGSKQRALLGCSLVAQLLPSVATATTERRTA